MEAEASVDLQKKRVLVARLALKGTKAFIPLLSLKPEAAEKFSVL